LPLAARRLAATIRAGGSFGVGSMGESYGREMSGSLGTV
jgi:hypothetical protein